MDASNPLADAFMKSVKQLQQAIVGVAALLKPKQVVAVKLHHSGVTNVAAANQLGVAALTIGHWLRLPDAVRLLSLLHHYHTAMEGPNEALRRNMLWRIAARLEEDEPRVAILALTEINRMAMNFHDRGIVPTNNAFNDGNDREADVSQKWIVEIETVNAEVVN